MKRGKYKILTITTSGLRNIDGIATVIIDYYSLFNPDEFALDIIADGEYSENVIDKLTAIGVRVHFLPSRKKKYLCYIRRLTALLKKGRYDAVYVHGSSATVAVELTIARLCGCGHRVVHSHNTVCRHEFADRILRPLFNRSYTKALACGSEAGKWLFGKREFEIIRNARDVEVYRFNESRRREVRAGLGLHDNELLIGHVGNFNGQKNQKFLIGLMREVKRHCEDAKLIMVGDGRLRGEVAEAAKAAGLENDIVFTGSVSNVPDMLQAMDVAVLPSLYEGLPLVAIEWQISALPCLLSDTITRECAYTCCVHFLSLSEGESAWAEKLLKYRDFDRVGAANECVRLTIENGYSLHENVNRLQNALRGAAN